LSEFSLTRAGHWFLHSGIQEPSGGFARFYRSEIRKNLPVSTEISGYAASALIFLYRSTKDEEYLDAARRTADFLVNRAWDESLQMFPYEYPSPSGDSRHLSYFFDSGIIIRGLLAIWREIREDRLLDVAISAARGMSAFWSGRDYHPIVTLPDQKPLPGTAQWSTAPGCCRGFLAGADDRLKIMDRLHAYCYFLEALSPLLGRLDCVETYDYVLTEAARFLRELAPEFVRSDVFAQVLRARVRASHAIPFDVNAAREEAAALAGFQVRSDDARIDGGFLFGKRGGEMSPHVNPVSTTFAVQALEMWRAFEAGESETCLQSPI